MSKRRRVGDYRSVLVAASPLRAADPRAKLGLSLCASLLVMLPLERLAVAVGLYAVMLLWARLARPALRQLWRLKIVLGGLFLLDWQLVGLDLAVVVTLRLALLAGAFTLMFATTTPGEFQRALEWFGVPYRYAFSVGLAFQSLALLDDEWRTILEAQQARGAWSPPTGWRVLLHTIRDWVALTVPAIVMTTQRAWSITEAAYARGFDSPHRKPYRVLRMKMLDWALLVSGASVALALWLRK